MDIKDKIKNELNLRYGNFETYLETLYEKKLTNILLYGNLKEKFHWSTYNQLILEIKNNETLLKELQYNLTDNINPKKACLNILDKIKNKTPEQQRLLEKIQNF